MDYYEQQATEEGAELIAGVDEAGRGPLAGPVVAASVLFNPPWPIESGINDSKALSAKKRKTLSRLIYKTAASIGVGVVWPEEIDRINIHAGSLLAMRRAVAAMKVTPDRLLIDGRFKTGTEITELAIVKGDAKSVSIAAASIIAKTVRDTIMEAYSHLYPNYGFSSHKGYGTAAHLLAIKKHGPSSIHRMSYRPMSEMAL
ncbi:MAG: ribonuclease HII [Proteobacteria bacterium]|nr:ribonuclease HII [Pseudomonadota bacterium]